MYRFLNLHPKGKFVGDCVKRSLTLLTGNDYMEVSRKLNEIKRQKHGTAFNNNKVWKAFVAEQGWQKICFPAVAGEPRMNGERFCQEFKKGAYLLRMAHHLTAVVDGVIYDTFDCSMKCVYVCWKVR